MAECVDFGTSMGIRCGSICEISAESQKFKISDISIYISIAEKISKFQGSEKKMS